MLAGEIQQPFLHAFWPAWRLNNLLASKVNLKLALLAFVVFSKWRLISCICILKLAKMKLFVLYHWLVVWGSTHLALFPYRQIIFCCRFVAGELFAVLDACCSGENEKGNLYQIFSFQGVWASQMNFVYGTSFKHGWNKGLFQ